MSADAGEGFYTVDASAAQTGRVEVVREVEPRAVFHLLAPGKRSRMASRSYSERPYAPCRLLAVRASW